MAYDRAGDVYGRIRRLRRFPSSPSSDFALPPFIEGDLPTPTGSVTTNLDYDRDGNVSRLTTPAGVVSTFVYDDFGQLVRETNPATGDIDKRYDPAGNLVREIRASGLVTEHSYDALNRLKSSRAGPVVDCATAPAGTPLSELRLFYDTNPTCTFCEKLGGRLARAEVDLFCDGEGPNNRFTATTDFSYDYAGRIDRKEEFAVPGGRGYGTPAQRMITTWKYRRDGLLRLVGFPDGDFFLYNYGPTGNVTDIEELFTERNVVSNVRYFSPFDRTLSGWTNGVTFGGKEIDSFTFYTPTGILSRKMVRNDPEPGAGTNLLDISIAPSFAGRASRKQVSGAFATGANLRSSFYRYDGLGRLRCATSAPLGGCEAVPDLFIQSTAAYGSTDRRLSFGFVNPQRAVVSRDTYAYAAGSDRIDRVDVAGSPCVPGAGCTGALTIGYDPRGSGLRTTEDDSRFPLPGGGSQRLFGYSPA